MTKFDDQQPQEKFFAFSRIDEQTKRLSAEALSSIEAAINYLFLTHAGGAVAILSFLSSSDAKRPTGPLIALALFSVGLILVGVIKAFRVHYFDGRSISWLEGAGLYFKNEIDWSELNRRYAEAAREPRWPYYVGYFSFACLVIGAAIGFFLLACAS